VGEDCSIPCSGHGVGDKNGCDCDEGFTGVYCEKGCDDACKTCKPDDHDFCLTCHGIRNTGERCERCIGNYKPTDCEECLPQYFGDDCEHYCVNGKVIDNLCICDDFHAPSTDPTDSHGTCIKVDCFGGCLNCETNVDYSDCHSCKPGYFDINADKPELEFAYCLPGCPTGFKLDANDVCTRSAEE